ncbi:sialidase family protein, partial [uncultured Wocania sp.]|uniref:sialidase family protein n=1 Tax=uncultured Wocania sp. TaxID=2834404 RepID=UPI0030FBA98A
MTKNSIVLIMIVLFYSCGVKLNTENNQTINKSLEFVTLFSSGMEDGVACYRIPAIVTALNGD